MSHTYQKMYAQIKMHKDLYKMYRDMYHCTQSLGKNCNNMIGIF